MATLVPDFFQKVEIEARAKTRLVAETGVMAMMKRKTEVKVEEWRAETRRKKEIKISRGAKVQSSLEWG